MRRHFIPRFPRRLPPRSVSRVSCKTVDRMVLCVFPRLVCLQSEAQDEVSTADHPLIHSSIHQQTTCTRTLSSPSFHSSVAKSSRRGGSSVEGKDEDMRCKCLVEEGEERELLVTQQIQRISWRRMRGRRSARSQVERQRREEHLNLLLGQIRRRRGSGMRDRYTRTVLMFLFWGL